MRFLLLLLFLFWDSSTCVAALRRGLRVESLQNLENADVIHNALKHEHGNEEVIREQSVQELLETGTYPKAPKPKPPKSPKLKADSLLKEYLAPKGKYKSTNEQPKTVGRKDNPHHYEFENKGYNEDALATRAPQKKNDDSSDEAVFVYEFDNTTQPTDLDYSMLAVVTDLVLLEMYKRHYERKDNFHHSEIDRYEVLQKNIVKFDVHLYFEHEAPPLADIEVLTKEQLGSKYLDTYLDNLQTSNSEIFVTTTSVAYVPDQQELNKLLSSEQTAPTAPKDSVETKNTAPEDSVETMDTPKKENEPPESIADEDDPPEKKTSIDSKEVVPAVAALVVLVTLFVIYARARKRLQHSRLSRIVEEVPENLMKHKDDIDEFGTSYFGDDDPMEAYEFRRKSKADGIKEDLEEISLGDSYSTTSRTSGSDTGPDTPKRNSSSMKLPTLPKRDGQDDNLLPEWASRSSGKDEVDTTSKPPLPNTVFYDPSKKLSLSLVPTKKEVPEKKFISASPRLIEVTPPATNNKEVEIKQEEARTNEAVQESKPELSPPRKSPRPEANPTLSIPQLNEDKETKEADSDLIMEIELATDDDTTRNQVAELSQQENKPATISSEKTYIEKEQVLLLSTSLVEKPESTDDDSLETHDDKEQGIQKPAWLTMKPKTPPSVHRTSLEEHAATPTGNRTEQPSWMDRKLLKTPKNRSPDHPSSSTSTPEPEWMQKFRKMGLHENKDD